jgi:hypothetical protein
MDTGVTLREYFDIRFDASDKAFSAALAAQKEAITKAETASEKRFDGVNEFRNTLADQQRTLMPRNEVELMISNINARLTKIENTGNTDSGEKVGARNLWLVILGVVSLLSTVIGIVAYGLKP